MPKWILILALAVLAAACTSAPAATPTPIGKATAQPAATAAKPATEAPKPTAPAATAAPKAAVKPLDPPVTVKFGQTGVLADSFFYIAESKGYLAEEGLKMEFIRFKSASDMIAPLSTGDLDVGGGTPNPGLFNAIARGVPITIVGDRSLAKTGQATQALVVRKDLLDAGKIKDYSDLKGKTIAINALGTATEIDMEKALAKGNVKRDDVNVVALGFPDMVAALTNKAVDAAILVEPFITQAAEKGISVRWKGEDEIYPNHQTAVLLYGPNFYQKNPEAARRLMVAYLRGIRDYLNAFTKNVNKAQILSVLVDKTDLKDPALFDKMVVNGINPDGYVNTPTISEDQDWYVAKGYQQQKVDLSKVVDPQYMDYAIQRLGKFQQ